MVKTVMFRLPFSSWVPHLLLASKRYRGDLVAWAIFTGEHWIPDGSNTGTDGVRYEVFFLFFLRSPTIDK